LYLINKNIIIISPEAWGVNYVSKHHYSLELLKRGNRVVFLNPPDKLVFRHNIINQFNNNNLSIVSSPHLIQGLNSIHFGLRKSFHRLQAKNLLRIINQKVDIVWSFDPYRLQYLKGFKAKLNIYHAMDDHKSKVEENIVESADIIFTVSDLIKEKLSYKGKNCFKLNHGIGDHFISHKKIPIKKITKSGKINVGCVGNLHYPYLDISTFKQIISENNEVNFFFIGPYENSNLSKIKRNAGFVAYLKERKNVYLLGSKPSKELPSYLNQFDLFLICYHSNKKAVNTSNNHKIMEYFSTGKVVVSHNIDEYKNTKNLVIMANNNKDLPQLFKEVIKKIKYYNSDDFSVKRIDFASHNTYSHQLDRINQLISNFG